MEGLERHNAAAMKDLDRKRRAKQPSTLEIKRPQSHQGFCPRVQIPLHFILKRCFVLQIEKTNKIYTVKWKVSALKILIVRRGQNKFAATKCSKNRTCIKNMDAYHQIVLSKTDISCIKGSTFFVLQFQVPHSQFFCNASKPS